MNVWYIAAIVLGALATFSAFRGAEVASRTQNNQIENQLQKLGSDIQDLKLSPGGSVSEAKLDVVGNEYRELAEKYFQSLPILKAKDDEMAARQRVQELQESQEIEAHLRNILSEARKLADAYNAEAKSSILQVEANIPSSQSKSINQPTYVLLKFSQSEYWAVRPIAYPDRTVAIQFVRLVSPENNQAYEKMKLTNDSINLVLRKGRLFFGASLNQSMSDRAKSRITDGLNLSIQPMSEFRPFATNLLRRVIEFQILEGAK